MARQRCLYVQCMLVLVVICVKEFGTQASNLLGAQAVDLVENPVDLKLSEGFASVTDTPARNVTDDIEHYSTSLKDYNNRADDSVPTANFVQTSETPDNAMGSFVVVTPQDAPDNDEVIVDSDDNSLNLQANSDVAAVDVSPRGLKYKSSYTKSYKKKKSYSKTKYTGGGSFGYNHYRRRSAAFGLSDRGCYSGITLTAALLGLASIMATG